MSEEEAIILGEKEIDKLIIQFARSDNCTIEVIPVILQIANFQKSNSTIAEIISFFKQALDKKLSPNQYNIFLTSNLKSIVSSPKEELRRQIQLCFLDDSIPESIDSRKSLNAPDSDVLNLKRYIGTNTNRCLFFLFIVNLDNERLNPEFVRSLRQLNRIVTIIWE